MNAKLSNPTAELRDRYGIIVIGSGYGGSIAAGFLFAVITKRNVFVFASASGCGDGLKSEA